MSTEAQRATRATSTNATRTNIPGGGSVPLPLPQWTRAVRTESMPIKLPGVGLYRARA